jgi:hypothetical protein
MKWALVLSLLLDVGHECARLAIHVVHGAATSSMERFCPFPSHPIGHALGCARASGMEYSRVPTGYVKCRGVCDSRSATVTSHL